MLDKGLIRAVAVSPSGGKRMVRIVDLDEYLESNACLRPQLEDVLPRRPASAEVMMRSAGWDGRDHLGYVRPPRKPS